MFPLNANESYIKETGERTTLGNMFENNSSGSSFTPDYENDVLNIGTVGNYAYYIPMSKTYIGPTTSGYEITTKSADPADASIDLYSISVGIDNSIVEKELIQNISHKTPDYSDDNISITYSGSSWSVTLKRSYTDLEGDPVTSPVTWIYNTVKDLKIVEV